MKLKHNLYAVLLTFALGGYGQQWQVMDTLSVAANSNISAYSIDPEGRIYLGTTGGNIHRFDKDGHEHELFSAIANFEVTSITAWNRFKVFIYYDNPQEFYYLDRFNTLSNAYSITSYTTDLATLCAPGVDNSIWVLSASFNELRKYNEQSKQLHFIHPLQIDVSNISHLRAYQNLVIISDEQEGLKFFDQFGNLLRELNYPGIHHFQVSATGKLIFLTQGEIKIMDPFASELAETVKAPEGAFTGVLKYEEDFYLIQQNRVLVYRRL